MSKDNSSFFASKNDWSKVKDDLLRNYLGPYFSKLFLTYKPILYIDGFAGKGMFDDGQEGSPIIACKIIQDAIRHSKNPDPKIDAVFIEKKYAEELKKNLEQFSFAQVIPGEYQTELDGLEELGTGRTLFMYVDPFGIKYLDCGLFDKISKHFDSAEVLLNFNSFGFVRAACRLYGIEYLENEDFTDIKERDPWTDMPQTDASKKLTEIVRGEYWKAIIEDFKDGNINGYEAEVKLVDQFCQRLQDSYKYVLNIPVRIKEGHRPKYRMIHLSNHPDGCILMYNNMQKRIQELFNLQYGEQRSLFDLDSENEIIDVSEDKKRLREFVGTYTVATPINVVLADFVTTIRFSTPLKVFYDEIAKMEKDGFVEVSRTPAITQAGKPTRFKQPSGKNKIDIKYIGKVS